MSIMINKDRCKGCRKCIDVCPGSLIKFDNAESKAYMKYPKDCWGCCSCIKECKVNAISLYLGADIGGCGSLLNVNIKGDYAIWKIEKNDGKEYEIKVNRKDSNKY